METCSNQTNTNIDSNNCNNNGGTTCASREFTGLRYKWRQWDTYQMGRFECRLSSSFFAVNHAPVSKAHVMSATAIENSNAIMSAFKATMQRFGVKNVVIHTELITTKISSNYYDNAHCPNGRYCTSYFTDVKSVNVLEKETTPPHGYFCGGGKRVDRIVDAKWIVYTHSGRHPNGCNYNDIYKLDICPTMMTAKDWAILFHKMQPFIGHHEVHNTFYASLLNNKLTNPTQVQHEIRRLRDKSNDDLNYRGGWDN